MEELLESEIGSSVESVQKLLDSQRELFHSQIDQLQSIVVTQCKLTGVNPLSQEMAAGALSIKIGKRPRDLLNPKAVKYMQLIFSIKDAISKKESREISALFGVTVTQVRDFFASQRSRVRKIVRLSREKVTRSNACNDLLDGVSTNSDSLMPIDPVPLNSVGPISVEEAPSCSNQDEALPGIDDSDKHFLENIFSLMRKEESFSGQVKLMEWILRIQNPSVLHWFLTKDGVMILATWLSQAAIEEQTSILLVILKVLCHLPLHKALPVHMSAILQSVNRLRFYRTSDISNRARVLLAKWSKMFARSQALKKPNGMKPSYNGHKEIMLNQSFGEIMGDESWQSNLDIPEEVLADSYENSENFRKLESPQTLKLLPASTDETNRKHILGVSPSQNRERRKVQLVEQPGQKSAGRSTQVTRAVTVSQGRPMSADDIQKAKMRAQFMQSKYGKTGSSSSESKKAKIENSNKSSPSQPSILLPISKVNIQPKIEEQVKPKFEEQVKPKFEEQVKPKNEEQVKPVTLGPKAVMDSNESLLEKCKRVQIPWQTPPEMELHEIWRVGGGENSKEVEVQRNRNRREKETIYRTSLEIPSNPKEPWDVEMDYDDSLTTEIPTEQLPDADGAETQFASNDTQQVVLNEGVKGSISSAPASSNVGNASAPEPDLELLAVLLKNPELVFALTSGQAGNLSSEETVKLLDMIKAGEVGLPGSVNGLGGKVEEKIEVSLPSPTPSSNPGTSGWQPEVAKNPFSQQGALVNRSPYGSSGVAVTAPENLPDTFLVQPQIPATNASLPQHPTSVSLFPQQLPAAILENQMLSVHSPHQQSIPTNSSFLHTSATKRVVNPSSAAAMNPLQYESLNSGRPAPAYIPSGKPERSAISFPTPQLSRMPAAPMQSEAQPWPQPAHFSNLPLYTPPYPTGPPVGNPGPDSDFWRSRQGSAPNPRFQSDQNDYNTFVGHMQPGPPWERNEYAFEDEFESWSTDNSPNRSPEYMLGRNPLEPRMDSGRSYRTPDRSRQRNSSGYRDNNYRHGNRRWNWRERRR